MWRSAPFGLPGAPGRPSRSPKTTPRRPTTPQKTARLSERAPRRPINHHRLSNDAHRRSRKESANRKSTQPAAAQAAQELRKGGPRAGPQKPTPCMFHRLCPRLKNLSRLFSAFSDGPRDFSERPKKTSNEVLNGAHMTAPNGLKMTENECRATRGRATMPPLSSTKPGTMRGQCAN